MVFSLAVFACAASAQAQATGRRGGARADAGATVARTSTTSPAAFREPTSMAAQGVTVGAASDTDSTPSSDQLRGPGAPPPDQITGPIGPGDAARVIQAQMPRLRPCYERARETTPTLAGRVEVRVRIGPTGRVLQATAVGMPETPTVAACLAEALRQTVFPRPETAPLQIVYPVTFAPPPAPRRTGRQPPSLAATPSPRTTPRPAR